MCTRRRFRQDVSSIYFGAGYEYGCANTHHDERDIINIGSTYIQVYSTGQTFWKLYNIIYYKCIINDRQLTVTIRYTSKYVSTLAVVYNDNIIANIFVTYLHTCTYLPISAYTVQFGIIIYYTVNRFRDYGFMNI